MFIPNRPRNQGKRHILLSFTFTYFLLPCAVTGFTSQINIPKAVTVPSAARITQHFMSISKWNEEYLSADGDEEDDGLITKEMFLRDMLSEPARRKKKGSSRYKPHDNRDALPFVVKVKTPDPYTSSDEMLKQAKENSEVARKKRKKNKDDTPPKAGGVRRSNLVGMDGKYANAIAASIYARNSGGSLYKVLGEFELDKNTNCGDLIEVGDREFEVVTARSQFKYVGGKRFVMVRKILEVKELTRIAEEESLKRLMGRGDEHSSPPELE